MAKSIVRSPHSGYISRRVAPEDFEILSLIRKIEVIASGRGVRARRRLRRTYGGIRWRKMKGIAMVREYNGDTYEAEIHWYESHGVGKRDWKIKRRLG